MNQSTKRPRASWPIDPLHGKPKLLHSGLRSKPTLLYSGLHSKPTLLYSGLRSKPTLLYSGLQSKPTLLYSGLRSKPTLLYSGLHGKPIRFLCFSRSTVGRRFTYQALRAVLEPISRNRQQHCFKILWSFIFCPSGAIHRWSMVATLGVRRMASPELVIQSPQIRFHFRLYFSKKDQIARRREWFSGVSFTLFL